MSGQDLDVKDIPSISCEHGGQTALQHMCDAQAVETSHCCHPGVLRDGASEAFCPANCICSARIKISLIIQRDNENVALRCNAVTVSTASGVNSLVLSRLSAAAPIRSLHEAPTRRGHCEITLCP